MLGRIIELASDGGRVSVDRGFLVIENETGGGRVPLDDIEAVIASAQALSYTNAALAALAARGAPVVICGRDYAPTAVVMPISGQFEQGVRMAAQANAAKPLCKRLWSQIVQAKIRAQAGALDRIGVSSTRLTELARTVRSGDPANFEAQAAQVYWPAFMGKTFRRDREAAGANAFLNYGYAVLRAATARAVVGAGLHPSLSIQHQSRGDALRLADDLMEPFRPAVDLIARDLVAGGATVVDKDAKGRLAGVLHADYRTAVGVSNLSTCLSRLSLSLARAYLRESDKLDFPLTPVPLAPDLLSQA
ncbi:MAG: type II CRISPR-associated endonuclease Cas1 [Hyphomonadaceae bacterium]|nr:type II CRISPR-associated endonuclease Cas1 [Hyphomonadaceae bacterium]